MYTCMFSFLLWVDCSTEVGQFIILYSETITGNLMNKWQWRECKYYWFVFGSKKSWKLVAIVVTSYLCVSVCLCYLGEKCEQVFVVGQLQMFGVKSMQCSNFSLIHFPSLVVYILHICYRGRTDICLDLKRFNWSNMPRVAWLLFVRIPLLN